MSELVAGMRDAIAALAAADPKHKRFGAGQHRYELLPPIATDLDLPADYREYLTTLSRGGAGPYYGLVRIDRNAPIEVPRSEPSTRALPIAHLGCGYAALLLLDGPNRGQVWLDARALDIVTPIFESFTAFVLDWIDRLANHRWLDGFVPPGECAITTALSGYLGVIEQRLGIAAGTLEGEPLRSALADLGPGAIEVAADRPLALFAPGDRLDPCATCARALQGLVEQGLRSDVVATGLRPLPDRAVTPIS